MSKNPYPILGKFLAMPFFKSNFKSTKKVGTQFINDTPQLNRVFKKFEKQMDKFIEKKLEDLNKEFKPLITEAMLAKLAKLTLDEKITSEHKKIAKQKIEKEEKQLKDKQNNSNNSNNSDNSDDGKDDNDDNKSETSEEDDSEEKINVKEKKHQQEEKVKLNTKTKQNKQEDNDDKKKLNKISRVNINTNDDTVGPECQPPTPIRNLPRMYGWISQLSKEKNLCAIDQKGEPLSITDISLEKDDKIKFKVSSFKDNDKNDKENNSTILPSIS